VKKILILGAISISVILCSCELILGTGSGPSDITLTNNCGFDIQVNISTSNKKPSVFIPIANMRSQKFSVENGYYYVHIIRTSTLDYFVTNDTLQVNKNDTWTIKYDTTNSYSIQGKISSFVPGS